MANKDLWDPFSKMMNLTPCMKENGLMILKMGEVYRFGQTEPDTTAIGVKAWTMASADSLILTAIYTLGSGNVTNSTDMEKWYGLIKVHMKGNSSKPKSKATENTLGKMGEFLKENGKTTWWMERAHSFFQVGRNTRDSTKAIKSTVLVHFSGQMDANMSVNGSRENSMERAPT